MTDKPEFNRENYDKVLRQIINHPETHDQTLWHCGTSHCFAGWSQIKAGKAPNNDTVREDACQWLGITLGESDWLFDGDRTVVDFVRFREEPKEGYDRAGFNRTGYDRDGYARYGYDRDGYDRYGYDRDGFNRTGYDRQGRNRSGELHPEIVAFMVEAGK